jgi:hypothetical protein
VSGADHNPNVIYSNLYDVMLAWAMMTQTESSGILCDAKDVAGGTQVIS